MFTNSIFRKPKNELEFKAETGYSVSQQIQNGPRITCTKCKRTTLEEDYVESFQVCISCGHHKTLSARERIKMLLDKRTFEEFDSDLSTGNPIDFPNYAKKIELAQIKSGEKEAVICGKGKIGGYPVCVFVMNGEFMMGSMGSVVGEKITRLFEYATEHNMPVLGCTVSGGARMQEGIISLMQMAKTSGAVKRHSDSGLLYITLLTNPTTGGVTASFAMEGDIIISEPGALIGFAGPRIIEQTIRQKLPKGFQRAEFLKKKGFIDAIVPRERQKKYIQNILALHIDKEIV